MIKEGYLKDDEPFPPISSVSDLLDEDTPAIQYDMMAVHIRTKSAHTHRT